MNQTAENFYTWLSKKYPSVELMAWQRDWVERYFSNRLDELMSMNLPRACGKTFLATLLTDFKFDDMMALVRTLSQYPSVEDQFIGLDRLIVDQGDGIRYDGYKSVDETGQRVFRGKLFIADDEEGGDDLP